jgi:hypothetical protein
MEIVVVETVLREAHDAHTGVRGRRTTCLVRAAPRAVHELER